MSGRVDLDDPFVRGTAVVLLGVALCLYYLPLAPVVTAYVLYCGVIWYRSGSPRRKTAGIGLLVVGVLLVGFSYVVLTGYVTTSGFESGFRTG